MPSAEDLLSENLYLKGATPVILNTLERDLSISLPESYRRFMLRSNGCDGPVGELWIILYAAERVSAETTKHRLSIGVEEAVFIGTDGGGEAYIIDTRQSPPRFGSIPFIGDGLDDISFVSETLDEFVQKLSEA